MQFVSLGKFVFAAAIVAASVAAGQSRATFLPKATRAPEAIIFWKFPALDVFRCRLACMCFSLVARIALAETKTAHALRNPRIRAAGEAVAGDRRSAGANIPLAFASFATQIAATGASRCAGRPVRADEGRGRRGRGPGDRKQNNVGLREHIIRHGRLAEFSRGGGRDRRRATGSRGAA